jgi:hypothetical protein
LGGFFVFGDCIMKKQQRFTRSAIALACATFSLAGNVYAASCPNSTAAFSLCDEFNGAELDTSVWKVVSGGSDGGKKLTSVKDGYLDLAMNQASQGDVVFTEFAAQNRIKLTVVHNMHPNGAHFLPSITLRSSDSRDVIALSFKRPNSESKDCKGALGNDDKVVLSISNGTEKPTDVCSTASARPFYNKADWTKTIIEYNADTGRVTVDLQGDGVIDIEADVSSGNGKYIAGISIAASGWWTGHWYKVDSIRVEGGSSAAPSVQDIECFFNWGEKFVPDHLTPHQNTKTIGSTHYRGPYTGGILVGHEAGSVIATGGVFGAKIATLGTFSEFLAAAKAANCGGVVKPNSCTSQSMTWAVGNQTCQASSTSTATGQKVTLASTNGKTGNATFACNDGKWSAPQSTTCEPPPPNSCAPQSISWIVVDQTCQASTTSTASGQNATLTSTNGKIGSATVVCTDGKWGTPPQATTCAAPPSNSCAAESLSWTVSGQICQTTSAVTIAGQTAQLDSTNGKAGKATFVCNNGQWGKPQQVTQADTCATTPPTASCDANPSISWKSADGAGSCVSSIPKGNATTSQPVSSVATLSTTNYKGNASFTCTTNADGTAKWIEQPGSSCTKSVEPTCPTTAQPWTGSDGTTCKAAPSQTSGSVTFSATAGVLGSIGTGTATFKCDVNGTTATWKPEGSSSCVKPTPTTCAPEAVTWGASNSCSSTTPSGSVGSPSGQLTFSNASFTGTAAFTCQNINGTAKWVVEQSGSKCEAKAPVVSCETPKSVKWGTGSACSATIPSTVSTALNTLSGSLSPTDSSLTGSATFKCVASSDGKTASWMPESGSSCEKKPAASCSPTSKTWTVSGNTCTGTTVQSSTPSGDTASFTTGTGAATRGSTIYSCTDGVWAVNPVGQATCTTTSSNNDLPTTN